MSVSLIPLSRIVLDPTLTARAERPPELVRQYAADMEDGHVFPPLTCFTDGVKVYLVDGWLRYLAAKQMERSHVEAAVLPCSRREMRLHAAAANTSHGAARSHADRRLAVIICLEEMPSWTVPQVVKHCKVSPSLVSGLVAVRARMPGIQADAAAAKSARETLGLPVKPATPKAPLPPVPKPAPPVKFSPPPPAPKPAAPKPSPVSVNPWVGAMDPAKDDKDDDEHVEEEVVEEEPETADEDDDGDEFDELDRERLRERMMRSGRKFARFLDAYGGLTDAEAMALIREDMRATAAREARRGRPEKPAPATA